MSFQFARLLVFTAKVDLLDDEFQYSISSMKGSTLAVKTGGHSLYELPVAGALAKEGGRDAATLRVAEEYIKQLGSMATNSDLLIVPSNVGDPNAMIASAFSVFDSVKTRQSSGNTQ